MCHNLALANSAIKFSIGAGKDRAAVKVNKEVIVSGGAVGSPRLLQVSGIGPAASLAKANVTAIIDLPGVGTNYRVLFRSDRFADTNDGSLQRIIRIRKLMVSVCFKIMIRQYRFISCLFSEQPTTRKIILRRGSEKAMERKSNWSVDVVWHTRLGIPPSSHSHQSLRSTDCRTGSTDTRAIPSSGNPRYSYLGVRRTEEDLNEAPCYDGNGSIRANPRC
jgi:choline dehydrogenase-like flavoprotein